MQIRHFLYNCFLIEQGEIKIAIDPGQNLWLFDLRSLIPKSEWSSISHVLVTHGDPDHYWQADRLATAANAPLVLNKTMVEQQNGETRILAPRQGGMRYVPYSGQVIPMGINETTEIDGVHIQTICTQHGPIEFTVLGMKIRKIPGPNERAGFGSIGYRITVGEHTLVNLGDSLLQDGWAELRPDVLMLPIGGLGNRTWTMDVTEALKAVEIIKPRLVIPCHYNVPFFWTRHMAKANDQAFRCRVEEMGRECKRTRAL